MSVWGPRRAGPGIERAFFFFRTLCTLCAMLTNRKILLWLIPILFALHNVEEALFMKPTLAAAKNGLPRFMRILLPPVSYEQFMISLIVVTIAAFLFAAFGRLDRPHGPGVYLLVGLQVVLFLNAFAHLVSAVMLDGYSAGLGTALAVNLPFSLLIFWQALKQRWVSGSIFAAMFPVGLFVLGPILFGILFFSGILARALFPG